MSSAPQHLMHFEGGNALSAFRAQALLARLQASEEEGYMYESAEASFELLCRKELGLHRSFWDLLRDEYESFLRLRDLPGG